MAFGNDKEPRPDGAASSEGGRLADSVPKIDRESRTASVDQDLRLNTNTSTAEGCVTLDRAFEVCAASWPSTIALVGDGRRISYQELETRSEGLVPDLLAAGVSPEVVVGIFLESSVEQVSALLAVLKAGGVYLPLDPAYPRERLAAMLTDAGVEVLITDRRGGLPGNCRHVIRVDQPTSTTPTQGAERRRATASNLAYMIYTSGSTGRPKGVSITHQSACRMAAALAEVYDVGPGRRQLQFAALGFDASVAEILTSLLSGATLVLMPRDAAADPAALSRILDDEAVTTVTLPPSLAATLPDIPLPALKTLVVAGEACPEPLVRRWAPRTRMINAYGPTEGAVCATTARCQADGKKPSIGKPLSHTTTYVLGRDFSRLLAGVTGELHLGGEGVARGYLNRPALTADRFQPDPYGGKPGERLYRTGDLACRQADGNLDYQGRDDHQVKVRGVRIELGEIESVLAGQPGVAVCAVVVHSGTLVAFVVPQPGADWDEQTLREGLAERLPQAMLPARYCRLQALPKTLPGKIDRAALDQLAAHRETPADSAAPVGPIAARLAEIWCQLLGVDEIRGDDDFLALGGHSLSIAQMLARVRDSFSVEVPIADFLTAPTVDRLADHIPAGGRDLPALVAADRNRPIPLSFSQQRVWYLAQLTHRNVAYNTQVTLQFAGGLSFSALHRAIIELVRRHEILRTVFAVERGEPVQRVQPPCPVPLPVVDLSALSPAHQALESERRMVTEARRPFHFGRIPLARWLLLHRGPTDSTLVQTEHHLVHDGWSLAVLLRELRELYNAFATATPPTLGPLPAQFGDIAVWQHELLRGATLEALTSYWQKRLQGCPPSLELPVDRPRPPVQSHRGAVVRGPLPQPLYDQLQAMSREHGITRFMAAFAVYGVLLHRHSGQRDLVIGTTVANRRLQASETVLGMLVNNVALRLDLHGDLSFADVLAQVRDVTLGAFTHEDLPFDKVVEVVAPERDPGRNPLFQHLFSFHDAPIPELTFGGVPATLHYRHHGSAKFDIDVVMIPRGEQRLGRAREVGEEPIEMVWEYCRDLFDPTTIERLSRKYQTLMATACLDPGQSLSTLPMLGASERHQLAVEAQGEARAFDTTCLVEQITDRGRQTPDAIAVVDASRSLSYRQLVSVADSLAGYLRARGVGPESRVGVLLERSPEMVAALLGVLQAGAAYLPLDPGYPTARLDWMLRDAGAEWLITRRGLVGRLSEIDVGVLEVEKAVSVGAPRDESFATAEPSALAYLIYTSGSTGQPKAIGIPRGALANHARATIESYRLEPRDRLLQLASISFDVSAEEIFPTLIRGATLILAPAAGLEASQRGLTWLERQQVSVANLPASFWHEWVNLLEADAGQMPSGLRLVVVGNEAVSARRWQQWQQLTAGRIDWRNAYGPTEGTITATVDRPGGKYRPAADSMPIGRPLANVETRLLGSDLEPVALDVPAEIYIGGPGLARGYLGRPSQTAIRFVPHRSSEEPGARLYATGDRARWLADGRLQFLGRVDLQLKVRGFRIEPGEIETMLESHSAVGRAVVDARPDRAGHMQLVAYCEGDAEKATSKTLRAFLSERLPAYLVPTVFVRLDALPRLPGGKIDRRRLPEPEIDRRSLDADYIPPRAGIEALLAEIWQQLLGVERVGVRDNFFALGGHSLLATRLLFRVSEAFGDVGAGVALADFLRRPTVAELAAQIEAATPADKAPPIEAIDIRRTAEDDELHVPLSFAQRRLWFLAELEPDNAFYNIARAFTLDGPLDGAALAGAIQALLHRHWVLRTAFVVAGGTPLQRVAPVPPQTLTTIDLTDLPESRREKAADRLALDAAVEPFDLGQPPLLRARLLRLGAMRHRLILVVHHIAADGWSLGLLFDELSTLYTAARNRRPSPLAPLPIQYLDYALLQRRQLREEWLTTALDQARMHLADTPAVLELPTDRPRPREQRFRGARCQRRLDGALKTGLETFGRRLEASLFTTLLTGFTALLHHYSRQDDIVVGSPVANRTRPETERLIGFFANTLVLRANHSGDPSFQTQAERVHHGVLDALSRQDLPFERLVDALKPDRDLGHAPLFQVLFVLQDAAGGTLTFPELEVTPEELDNGAAIFDLTLAIEDEPEGLRAVAQYNTDLFDGATVARLLRHYETLLLAAANDPERPLSRLAELPATAWHQSLVEWNDTVEETAAIPLLDLVLAQAIAEPDAAAVIAGDQQRSYAELVAHGASLARRLRQLGVGTEDRIGLYLERDLTLPETVLGVLAAGAAYVPLDPSYPRQRLELMVRDAGVRVIVATADRISELEGLGAETLAVEDTPEVAANATAGCSLVEDAAPILTAAQAHPDQLAYVIYTSGSTGSPKGVALSHRALTNLIHWQLDASELDRGGRTLQFASLSFDVSFQEIFSTLGSGGTLVMVDDDERRDPQRLLACLAEAQVERIFMPSIALHHLAEAAVARSVSLGSLREIISAGEQLRTTEAVVRLAQGGAPATLANQYGPSETHVVTGELLRGSPETWPALPAIGRPITGTSADLLSPELAPVPIGVPGELYLGGIALARGYVDQPGVTAQRFVPDPFTARPGGRLYRTGDLASWAADGSITFHGRADHQLKIRGFRIEPGEIEAALEQHPWVKTAVAVAREDTPGDRRLVAFWVPQGGTPSGEDSLGSYLRERLPEHLVPARFEAVDELPTTPSGKVDRRVLTQRSLSASERRGVTPRNALERRVAAVWCDVLAVDGVGADDNFFDLGGHSLLLPRVQEGLRQDPGIELPIVDLFRYPTVASLARRLDGDSEAAARPSAAPRRISKQLADNDDHDIAIIGMACRLPGARDVEAFWQNLAEGVESITVFDDEQLRRSGVDPTRRDDPDFVPAGGVLDDIDGFDAAFFGFSPREAEILDPQHRAFLENAWHALEHAGYDPERHPGRIGVFAGTGVNTYWLNNLQTNPERLRTVDPFHIMLLNDKDYLPTRVSYKLGLRGPSLSVQTACSTSLVALHLACNSLRAGECDIALAGGVSIRVPQHTGYTYREEGIMSPDGHCRAFDASAAGTVGGNGVAIVALKRRAEARAEGDRIYAVIKGTAINNDGGHKIGYTAPSVDGQAEVIAEAQAAAGVDPDTVTYIEAHGTGTHLGDPIEIAALTEVFRRDTARRGYCAVGSVKTNIGHLDTAAGVTGVIKTALALDRRQIPPSLGFSEPNPELGLAASPFHVPTELRPWDAATPRRAGVSSFGIGGTNVHAVLEEASAVEREADRSSNDRDRCQLLVLSARTSHALDQLSGDLADHLEAHPTTGLADVAYTLQLGRHQFGERRALVARDPAVAAAELRRANGGSTGNPTAGGRPATAWLFPGQGAQYPAMGRGLYLASPVFRDTVDHCLAICPPRLADDLRAVLMPNGIAADETAARLRDTSLAQPALFIVEHALATLLFDQGLAPQAMVGHSIGEYVAACLAGVFGLEDALELVIERGLLMASATPGAMLAVSEDPATLVDRLPEGLEIAAINAPGRLVVAGPEPTIATFARQLTDASIEHRRLQTSHAFHSASMDALVEPFTARVATVRRQPPTIPFVSNVTGTWITDKEAQDPAYWGAHLRQTVRFGDAVRLLAEEPTRVFLEVGPGNTLTTLVRRAIGPTRPTLHTLRHPRQAEDDEARFMESVGQLWLHGEAPDWERLHPTPRRRVALPLYPFEHRRYWIDSNASPETGERRAELPAHEPLDARSDETTIATADPSMSELEVLIADLWQEYLGVERLGVADDFFSLGGDSMIATQFLARLHETLPVRIRLRTLFAESTVGGLARAIEDEMVRALEAMPEEKVEELL
ncbi:MAG: amino acid adenylation domain-containing protein [Acidobacteriota bacterium]